jgi:hypothetical protein
MSGAHRWACEMLDKARELSREMGMKGLIDSVEKLDPRINAKPGEGVEPLPGPD